MKARINVAGAWIEGVRTQRLHGLRTWIDGARTRLNGVRMTMAGKEARRRWIRRGALALTVLLSVSWFALGSVLRYRVDDNPAFAPAEATPRGSYAVDIAAALITREVDHYGWQPNDPLLYPTAFMDNPAHFQSGMLWAISRFTSELTDRIGRLGTASRIDEDLQRASGLLQYPGDVWVLDLRSLMPAPSETQYRSGRDALLAYNRRLAQNQAVFNARADDLSAMLSRASRDLGAEVAGIEAHLAQADRFVINHSADNLFYQTKGAVYAYAMLLDALGKDFGKVLDDRGLRPLWDRAVQALHDAASLHPVILLDGQPDSSLFASHLASQGYLVMRAQMRIADVLRALQV